MTITIRLAHQQLLAVRQLEFDAGRGPLILHRLHNALRLDLPGNVQPDMFRAQRPRSRHRAQLVRLLAAEYVGGADKAGHKRRFRPQIEVLGRINLFDSPIIKHRHAIGHRQGFALIVGHKNKGNAQRLLQFL